MLDNVTALKADIRTVPTLKTGGEASAVDRLTDALLHSTVARDELHANLPLFLRRQELSRILYIDELYRKIVPIHGVVMEFGVRWGANMALMTSLRGMYEPYNYSRQIVGFDTFDGFAGASSADGGSTDGDYSVTRGHDAVLSDLLSIHESFSPIPQLRKHELVKGDVRETLPTWLADNRHAVISLAYFDMDIYEPTRAALEAIKPRLHKGSIIAFDEVCCREFPGETQAMLECLDMRHLKLNRHPHQPLCAWVEL